MNLFLNFINECDANRPVAKNDLRNDFKLTLRANNLSETKLPFLMKKLMQKANGQSTAVSQENVSYHLDASRQYFIIDIDGHIMQSSVKKMWNKVQMCLDDMVFDIAFHIGAHDKESLPEQILACTQINRLSFIDAMDIDNTT